MYPAPQLFRDIVPDTHACTHTHNKYAADHKVFPFTHATTPSSKCSNTSQAHIPYPQVYLHAYTCTCVPINGAYVRPFISYMTLPRALLTTSTPRLPAVCRLLLLQALTCVLARGVNAFVLEALNVVTDPLYSLVRLGLRIHDSNFVQTHFECVHV